MHEDPDTEVRYYPGTREVVAPPPPAPEPEEEATEGKPLRWDKNDYHRRWYPLNGVSTEFFFTGAVAVALGRKPATIRLWERKGWIPPATYRTPAKGTRPGKRLYTRAQIEGMIEIAQDVGLLDKGLPLQQVTHRVAIFAERAKPLFRP